MPELDVLAVTRSIHGSWLLPISDEASITLTFLSNGKFFHIQGANSAVTKMLQVFKGDEFLGNWHVRPTRKAPKAKKVPIIGGGPARPSAAKPGPYLILNFTELPRSILNVRMFGVHADIANWFNNVGEIFRDGNCRILEFSQSSMRLEKPGGKIEVWSKVNDFQG